MKKESDNSPPARPRKMRFTPKVPPPKLPKHEVTKAEPSETKDDIVNKELLVKLNSAKAQDGFGRRMPKTERKVPPAQVAFGHGSSLIARSFGNPRSHVTGKKQEGSDASPPRIEKEYKEPWDYSRINYPAVLPSRMPYSGDPEILNKKEFEGDSANSALDETLIDPAKELSLMEPSEESQMIFFQLPATLPMGKQPAAAVGSNVSRGKGENASKKGCELKDLPAGFMGKMLVYKSGKIKMKLGDALFDVSPGMNCAFAQDVAAINVKEKHCCILGDLPKRVVVTPDIDSLLDSL